jgi:hypothetical protein
MRIVNVPMSPVSQAPARDWWLCVLQAAHSVQMLSWSWDNDWCKVAWFLYAGTLVYCHSVYAHCKDVFSRQVNFLELMFDMGGHLSMWHLA